jgi:hypothetical protein
MTHALRLVLVLSLVPAFAGAQEVRPAAVLLIPASTRALAMGGAFVVGATDPDAVFVNASFAAQLRGISLGATRFGGNADGAFAFSAAAGTAWWNGAVGFGLRTLGDTPGAASGAAASLAYALSVLGQRIALTASVLEQSAGGLRAAGLAFDAAASRNIGPLRIGLAARNLGPDIPLGDDEAIEISMPERFALNAATRTIVMGPLDATAALAWQTDEDGEWMGGLGAEAAYWPVQGRTFALRAGVQRGADHDAHLSAGAGFTGDAIAIEWGWRDGDGGVHRFSVILR